MTVTGVKIRPLLDNSGFYKAVATVYMGDYAINGILVAEGDKEGEVRIRFPFLPQKETSTGKRMFAFTSVSSRARNDMEQAIGKAYYKAKLHGGNHISSFSGEKL